MRTDALGSGSLPELPLHCDVAWRVIHLPTNFLTRSTAGRRRILHDDMPTMRPTGQNRNARMHGLRPAPRAGDGRRSAEHALSAGRYAARQDWWAVGG